MQNLFIYLLKVSVCYAAIYVFYIVLLRRVTHYTATGSSSWDPRLLLFLFHCFG